MAKVIYLMKPTKKDGKRNDNNKLQHTAIDGCRLS